MGLVISKPVISPLLVAFVQALALQRAAWQAVALPARRWHSQAPPVPGEGHPHRGSVPHLSLLGRAGHAAATSPPLLPHTSTAALSHPCSQHLQTAPEKRLLGANQSTACSGHQLRSVFCPKAEGQAASVPVLTPPAPQTTSLRTSCLAPGVHFRQHVLIAPAAA